MCHYDVTGVSLAVVMCVGDSCRQMTDQLFQYCSQKPSALNTLEELNNGQKCSNRSVETLSGYLTSHPLARVDGKNNLLNSWRERQGRLAVVFEALGATAGTTGTCSFGFTAFQLNMERKLGTEW